jgi:hypothetical protein
MDLTEGSETSAKFNLTPGKYPKENIQDSEHGENLKSRIHGENILLIKKFDTLSKRRKEQKMCKKDYIPRWYTQTPMNLLNHKYYNRAEEGTSLDGSAC